MISAVRKCAEGDQYILEASQPLSQWTTAQIMTEIPDGDSIEIRPNF